MVVGPSFYHPETERFQRAETSAVILKDNGKFRSAIFGSVATEAGEKATQYRNVFAASSVFFVLACVRTLFTTWAPLGSIHKIVVYLSVQVVNAD
jgi:hypothetical protein